MNVKFLSGRFAFCYTLLLLLLHTTVFSQENLSIKQQETYHIISFSSGLTNYTLRDEMMSPLIYSGSRMPFELSYRYVGQNHRQTLMLHYDNSDLTSSITNFPTKSHLVKNLNLSLEYSYSLNVAAINELKTNLYLGSKLISMLNMRNHYFTQSNSHTTAEQISGLGIYFLTETVFGSDAKKILTVELNIPFISYAILTNRFSAISGENFDDINFEENIIWQVFKKGELITFNKLFILQADLRYSYFFTNYLGVGFQYRFQYYSFDEFQSLLHSKVVNNQFSIGLMVKL